MRPPRVGNSVPPTSPRSTPCWSRRRPPDQYSLSHQDRVSPVLRGPRAVSVMVAGPRRGGGAVVRAVAGAAGVARAGTAVTGRRGLHVLKIAVRDGPGCALVTDDHHVRVV